VDKKFDIVKQAIDEWDPYGLLTTGAPSDEFDRKSRRIANKISKESSVKDIAIIISKVCQVHLNPFRQTNVGKRLKK
jgi:hypothetical protein